MEPQVYLVVFMDGNWPGYHSLPRPHEEASIPLVNVDEFYENANHAIEVMRDAIDGRFVLGVYTGVYCRELFYREPFIECWKRLVDQGGEIALHPHEEVVGLGSLVDYQAHMWTVLSTKYEQLIAAGIKPTAYRGGYFALSAKLMPIFDELNIKVDLSCLPGIEVDNWCAHWQDAPTSAYFLCPHDPSHVDCGHSSSQVLEIPLGWNGRENKFPENYLVNELNSFERLKTTWESILNRATRTEKPQFVQLLCHLDAIRNDDLRARCVRFLEFAESHGGQILTPSNAREIYQVCSITS